MTMLQEQAVQMIQDMSDDNVGFLIEVIQRLIPRKHIPVLFIRLRNQMKKCRRLKNW